MKRVASILCLILISLSAYSLHSIRVGQTLTLYYSVGLSGWSPMGWQVFGNCVQIVSQSGWHCTVKGVADSYDHYETVMLKYTNGQFTDIHYEYVEVLPNEPREVSLNYTSIAMDIGESRTLEASVYPHYVDYSLSWSSANESVATVSNGVVKGVGAGKTSVKVTTDNNKSASCSVTVYDPNPQRMDISYIGTMTVGDGNEIHASFSPQYSRSSVTWSSSNTNVVKVSGRGTGDAYVSAIGPGTATITATSANGLKATTNVTVIEPPFTITGQYPANNATDVPVLSTLRLDFSLPIYSGSNSNEIKLTGGGKEVEGSWVFEGKTFSFKPSKALDPYTLYTWTLPKGSVINQWNTNYSQTINIPFTTGGLSPLELKVSMPSGSVEPGDKVELTASEPDAVIYYTLDGSEPTEHSSVYKNPITINQDLTLRAFAYKDGYVKPIINESYLVTELCVVRKYPLEEKIYQYDKVNPYVEYSKEMKPGLSFNKLKVTTDKNQPVKGTFIANGKFLVFVPDKPLIPGHHYTITVPDGAVVMKNGDVNKATCWTFESGLYVRSIAASSDFSIALRSDDVLLFWGAMPRGYRGLMDFFSNYYDTPITIAEDVQEIDCGATHGLFVTGERKLYGWGKQFCHEYGWQGLFSEMPVLLDEHVSLFSAGGQASVWTSGGQTKGLGNNICHQLSTDNKTVCLIPSVLPLPATAIKQIGSGNGNTYFLTADGTLYGWGDNRYAQLLNYNHPILTEPIVLMHDVDTFAVSKNSFGNIAAIKKDGSLWTWGDNQQGQLGIGQKSYYSHPIQIMENILSVAVGNGFMAAVSKDHKLWMWGNNSCSQLGISNTTTALHPTKVKDGIVNVSLGDRFAMALDEGGGVWQWGLKHTSDTDQQYIYTPKEIIKGRKYDDITQLTIINADIKVAPNEQAVACAIPSPYSALMKKWEWSSSDETVAIVDERGVITGVGKGIANIKLTTDKGVEASCVVNVDASYSAVQETILPADSYDIYDLRGHMIRSGVTSTNGLSKGIYIINNRKVIIQ